MKRLHVHVSVKDLQASIRFYRTLFGAEPVVTQPDYAKWMLDDPRVNFAISMNRQPVGVNHLGFQVESDEELRGMRAQLEAAVLPDRISRPRIAHLGLPEASRIRNRLLSGSTRELQMGMAYQHKVSAGNRSLRLSP